MKLRLMLRKHVWPDDGMGALHRLVLRLPDAFYVCLIVVSIVSCLLIVQRIVVPNVLPTAFWVLDLLVVTGFWLSHVRYRLQHR